MSSKKWNDPQLDAAQFTIGTAYGERGLHGLGSLESWWKN